MREKTEKNSPEADSFKTAKTLLSYIWQKADKKSKFRVIAAVSFLLIAKFATVYVPILYADVVNDLAPRYDKSLIFVPVALIFAYGLVRISASFFGELRDAVFSSVQQRTVRLIAKETFAHMHSLSLRFHLDRQTGSVARALSRGSLAVEQVLRLSLFSVVPTLIELLLVAGILWWKFGWSYALITLAAVSTYLTFTLLFTNWRLRLRRTMNNMDDRTQAGAVDSLLNYETVKYFNNEALEIKRFDVSLAAYEKAAIRSQVSLNFLNFGQALIIAVTLAVMMLMAAHGVKAGIITVGGFVLINTYLIQLYQPLNILGFVYREIRQGLADMEKMFELKGFAPEITEAKKAISLPAHPEGEVVFKDVHFGYNPDREILKGISFTVKAGHKVAVVGPTGAGKSTLSRLLYRFYDPTAGQILIDGQDIKDITLESLRRTIGVVPQDTVLFNDTIGYNIAYGRAGATDQEIKEAARIAQIHEFIEHLPNKYETRVGERGLKLSGGEKQRVSVARSVLKSPRILILDEATSALDTATERDIQAALDRIAKNRTSIVIAHRLSTIVDADEIIVLNKGLIAERGSHPELLAKGGLYAGMWAGQAEEAAVSEDKDRKKAGGEDSSVG